MARWKGVKTKKSHFGVNSVFNPLIFQWILSLIPLFFGVPLHPVVFVCISINVVVLLESRHWKTILCNFSSILTHAHSRVEKKKNITFHEKNISEKSCEKPCSLQWRRKNHISFPDARNKSFGIAALEPKHCPNPKCINTVSPETTLCLVRGFQLSIREWEFFFQLCVQDENWNFFLEVSCFKTRTRISFFQSHTSRREREFLYCSLTQREILSSHLRLWDKNKNF